MVAELLVDEAREGNTTYEFCWKFDSFQQYKTCENQIGKYYMGPDLKKYSLSNIAKIVKIR